MKKLLLMTGSLLLLSYYSIAQVTVFSEDFESHGLVNTDLIVAKVPGWTETAANGTFIYDNSSVIGAASPSAFIAIAIGTVGQVPEVLTSSIIDFGANTGTPTITFDYELVDPGFGPATLEILYKSTLGAPWIIGATYNATTLGVTNETVNLAGASSTFYVGFRVTPVLAFGFDVAAIGVDNIVVQGTPPPTIWTGATSTVWNLATNWDTGVIPTNTTNVQIPDVSGVSGRFPVISAAAACKDLTIDASASMMLSNTLEVSGDIANSGGAMAIAGTGILQLNKGGMQTLTGATTFGGTVEVKTASTLATGGNLTLSNGGSLLHGNTSTMTPTGNGGAVTGNVTVMRTGSGGSAWTYWSSPVTGAMTAATFPSKTAYQYNETNDDATDPRLDWATYSGMMMNGKGYAIQGMGMASFTGTATEGTITMPVTLTGAVDITKNGWNCVGNPYPSAVSISSFIAANNTDIMGTVYVWSDDNSTANDDLDQDYITINGIGTTASSSTSNYGNFATASLATGQGFMVIANGAGNVTFSNDMRGDINNEFFKKVKPSTLKINLISPSKKLFNQTAIVLIKGATDAEDKGFYDAVKLEGSDKIGIYSKIENSDNNFAIQGLALLKEDDNKSVDLGFFGIESGLYTIEFAEFINFKSNQTITLEDKYKNTTINLRDTKTYSFATESGEINDRFVIHFNSEKSATTTTGTTTAIADLEAESSIKLFNTNSTLYIQNTNNTIINSIVIYDLNGKMIQEITFPSKNEYTLSVARGMYLVKIVAGGNSFSKKLVIR